MDLAQIENLPLADLKSRHDELVKALGGSDLAKRYVQARTDAKMRDDKLAEQGRTVDALQTGIGATKEQLARETARADEAQARIGTLEQMNVSIEERLTKAIEAEKDRAAKLQANLSQETARANAAEALAKARRKALADVTGICNPLLAAE